MPVERIESWVLNAVSSIRFGSSMVSRRSSTRRAMERLTLASRGWPPRLREALTVGSGGGASSSRGGRRRAGGAPQQQDGAALAGDGGEEQVEHVLEQVGQRPVGEQRPRGLAEDLQ